MEFPCPSLDNIPLPDGAPQTARLRDRRKFSSQPTVSPGTSKPKISTDGQLTPFNMADVPLPSTNYHATTDPRTLSIPLPEGNNASSSSSSAPSKTMVDKLFEDFLSQIKTAEEPSAPKVEPTAKPAFTNSVEEIKRFLDKEINQLSCKAGFPESLVAAGIRADGIDIKSLIAAERGESAHREESTGTENVSTGGNQRTTPAGLPLKIKISDSSVARISSGHVSPPSGDQSIPDEFIVDVPVVIDDDSQPIAATAVSSESPAEMETEAKTSNPDASTVGDPIALETDHGSNGVAEVVEVTKPSKSSKKHKHKKKKSHKHSKDKNKSTPKLRSKKHKSTTKSHSKNKHKSSNGTKSPKKTSKTSHSKSKSSKKSKKTKTKTESKSKQSAENSEAESKSKKSKTRSSSPDKHSSQDLGFGKTPALGKISNENSALKSPKKDNELKLVPTIIADRKSRSRSRSKSPECSPAKKIMDPKYNPENNLVPKDKSLSPFQAKTLPLKMFSSPPLPALADPTSFKPIMPSAAPVTSVIAPSVLQAASVPPVVPTLQSQPHVTSTAEPPAASQPVPAPLSTVPITGPQPETLIQTPLASPALVSPLIPKLSSPLLLSSTLNRSSILPPAKSSPPVPELGGSLSLFKSSLGISPSIGILNKSQEKDIMPNCSQTTLKTEMIVSDANVTADTANKDSCLPSPAVSSEQTIKVGFSLNPVHKNTRISSPIDLSEPADKVSSSLKPLAKNSTAGQSGLLGLAAYFKSKAKSPSPDSTKDKKLAKSTSSSKKTKSFSDSSDDSSPKKRSRSASRKSSHSRSLSRSGATKHSSSDKRKKTRPRPKRSRSSSKSRSRSRSRSKSRRRPAVKPTKKRSRSRSRSRSNDRGRQSLFRSSKRRSSRSPSRSRNKAYGRSRSRSRSRGRNRVTGHRASRSRSPSKRAAHRRSRSRSRGRYRHHISSRSNKSKSRSRSRSRSNVRSRDKRSRSRSSGRHRDHRQSNNKYRRFPRRHSRSRSRSSSASSSNSRRRRSRSKSNSLGIDKVKLHDIAVKKLLESGQAPKEEVASLRAGGKTVQGLIDYCKRISQKELEESDTDETATKTAKKSDEEEEGPFIHHPFKIREAQPNIVLNIKNAKPLPVLTPQEKLIQSSTLRLQFPVSSGSQHRAKESQWVPVKKDNPSATEESVTSSVAASDLQNTIADVATMAAYTVEDIGLPAELPDTVAETSSMVTGAPVTGTPEFHSQTIEDKTPNVDNVFPDTPHQNVDISQVMTERMLAVQKLQENPNDVQALNVMYKAQREVNRWAQSKQLPGQFTGSTGAKVMTQEELNGPDKRFQAWAKKLLFQVISVGSVVPLAAR